MPRQNLRAAPSDISWVSPWIRHASPQAGEQTNIKCTREQTTRRAAQPSVSCPLPRGTCVKCVRRPVSGLASLGVSPSQAGAQWHFDTPALAYRCGGSAGMVFLRTRTCFPFNRCRESALRHLARYFSLTAVDERADYSARGIWRPSRAEESRSCQTTRAPRKHPHALTGDAS